MSDTIDRKLARQMGRWLVHKVHPNGQLSHWSTDNEREVKSYQQIGWTVEDLDDKASGWVVLPKTLTPEMLAALEPVIVQKEEYYFRSPKSVAKFAQQVFDAWVAAAPPVQIVRVRPAKDLRSTQVALVNREAFNETMPGYEGHPDQPKVFDAHGVQRFKKNRLVEKLYDHAVATGLGLHELALMDFSDADRCQFAQLIGYSVSGYGDLSYVQRMVKEKKA